MELTSSALHNLAPIVREFTDEPVPERLLLALEAHASELEAELIQVKARLRELRIAAELCPSCGGTGRRQVRGGLYGELQVRKCSCQDEA